MAITKLSKKDLISILDLSREELALVLDVAVMLRDKYKAKEMFVPLWAKPSR